MKVFFITEDVPNCGSELIYAFVSQKVAEAYLNKKSFSKHRSEDDPSYAMMNVETEDDSSDKVYVVFSIKEGYDYDGEVIFYDETFYGAFTDKQKARKFLFHQLEEKPDESICLGLKEFPILTGNEEYFSMACKEVFRVDYQV